eukprot:Nk52_evm25s152 gene=Nk52_evmTU25s152
MIDVDLEEQYHVQLQETVLKIEELLLDLLQSLNRRELPCFRSQNGKRHLDLGTEKLCRPDQKPLTEYCKVWMLLSQIHRNLINGDTCVQRDFYYHNVKFLKDQNESNALLKRISKILKVSRQDMGIFASPRGFITGSIVWKNGDKSSWLQDHAVPIPGDLRDISLTGHSAKCIVLVEKESIFNYLREMKLTFSLPCILLTGQGYPSIATRALLACLIKSFSLPVFALVDYNPHGVSILLLYLRSLIEEFHCDQETLGFYYLGLHQQYIQSLQLPTHLRQKWSSRDTKIYEGIVQSSFLAQEIALPLRYNVNEMGNFKYKLECENANYYTHRQLYTFLDNTIHAFFRARHM